MCRYILQGTPCLLKGQCPFEHDRVRSEANKKKAQAALAAKGKGKGKPGKGYPRTGWKGKGKGKKGKGKKGKGKKGKGKTKGKDQHSAGVQVEPSGEAEQWYQDEEVYWYQVWTQDGEEYYEYAEDQSGWTDPSQGWTQEGEWGDWSGGQWSAPAKWDAAAVAEDGVFPPDFCKPRSP